jgi:transcriptional regulator with XRE-family HTH domain
MPESIGYQLKCARQEHHLSLEKVSEATRIRPYHLEALEADDYSKMPSAAQARGFLRLYAEFLGLDIEQMLDELRRAQGGAPQDEIVGPTPVAESGPDAGLIADLAEPTEESDKAPHQVIALAGKIRSLVQLVRDRVGGKAAETQPEQDEGRPQLEVELESEELVSETEKDEDASSTAQVAEAEEGDREQEQLFHLETAKGEARPFWVPWLNSLRAWLRLRLVVEAKESQPEAEGDQETMPAPGVQLLSSQEIFAEIGLQLRQRREMLSLSLDEIEQHIHVRGHLLRALELGNFDQLPSPVQTRCCCILQKAYRRVTASVTSTRLPREKRYVGLVLVVFRLCEASLPATSSLERV